MTLDRATVQAALRAEDVVTYFDIPGQWRGRWLRSRACAIGEHDSEAFGISQAGHWHCWAHDQGGDLLRLIAIGEKLDMRADFPRILEIAAQIAGVEDDESFGAADRPPPKKRDPIAPLPPLRDRVAQAKKRAAWVWSRLWTHEQNSTPGRDGELRTAGDIYLRGRGLDPTGIRKLEEIRETPMKVSIEEACKSPDLKSLKYTFGKLGIAIPVRAVDDGKLVDIRVRRFDPREGEPKIVGMLGGVTTGPAEGGRPRVLVGCYGNPHCIDPGPSRMVVCCEGAMDYLTGLQLWPDAQVLASVDAGSLALVVGHAARGLADYPGGKLLIVEQNDGIGAAADRSVNEDPNAATKVAVRILGPKRVGWLFAEHGDMPDGKDLNDLVRNNIDARALARWWVELP